MTTTNQTWKKSVPQATLAGVPETSKILKLSYFIDDNPPWHISIVLGFQHYLTMFGGTVALPLLIAKFLCAADNALAKSQLICTIFFVSGIATLLQSTIGVRLPIVQGGTFSFLAPTFAILTLPKWKCPEIQQQHLPSVMNSTSAPESTNGFYFNVNNSVCWKYVCLNNKTLNNKTLNSKTLNNKTLKSSPTKKLTAKTNATSTSSPLVDDKDIWKPRIREIQGAIIVSSLLQVIIGATGTMGFLMKYIGPLTITPAIALIGLSLFDVAAESACEFFLKLPL